MDNTVEIDWDVVVFNYDPAERVISISNWHPLVNDPLPLAFYPTSEGTAKMRPYIEAAIKKLVDSANAYMALELLQKDPAYSGNKEAE